jgi:hypothetical protein
MIKLRRAVSTAETLGTSDQAIVVANEQRKRLIICNGSSVHVWISMGETAVVGKGVFLAAAGGTFEVDPTEIYTGEIRGIAESGAANKVGVVEWT